MENHKRAKNAAKDGNQGWKSALQMSKKKSFSTLKFHEKYPFASYCNLNFAANRDAK